jgi:hypothetical protein
MTAISDPEYLRPMAILDRDLAHYDLPVTPLAQRPVILLGELTGCGPNIQLEHSLPSVWTRKRYVYTFFKPDD